MLQGINILEYLFALGVMTVKWLFSGPIRGVHVKIDTPETNFWKVMIIFMNKGQMEFELPQPLSLISKPIITMNQVTFLKLIQL